MIMTLLQGEPKAEGAEAAPKAPRAPRPARAPKAAAPVDPNAPPAEILPKDPTKVFVGRLAPENTGELPTHCFRSAFLTIFEIR